MCVCGMCDGRAHVWCVADSVGRWMCMQGVHVMVLEHAHTHMHVIIAGGGGGGGGGGVYSHCFVSLKGQMWRIYAVGLCIQ